MNSMNSKFIRRTALSVALGMCFASGVHAQSNATGSIFGSAAEPGSTVVILNTETGQTRTVTVGENGRFSVGALPVGSYKVELQRDGQSVATRENVVVRVGGGSEVNFAAGAQTLDAITVTAMGQSSIDVSSTDTRLVFTAEQLEKMPVGRNVNSIALLAPGAVAGDSRYSGVVSFGGASVTENAYYINGYAVTNPLTYLGSTELPYDAIAQAQVLTSGYGVEFGRATGGVVNIVTKRGTNEWKAGGSVIWSPDSARKSETNIRYEKVGTSLDGELYQNRADRKDDQVTYNLYASGPIVKDKLFFYVGGEFRDREVESYVARSGSTSGFTEHSIETPRWIAKIDWNINDNHSVELTAISDVTKETQKSYSYAYTQAQANANANATGEVLDVFQRGKKRNAGYYYEDGGELYIAKYTGYLTDTLTLTAMYGEQEQVHIATPWGYDPSVTYVSGTPYAGANPIRFGNVAQLADPDAFDKTKGGRIDLAWELGDHSLRLGYDRQDATSRTGETTAGPGYRWLYDYGTPNEAIQGAGGAIAPANGQWVERIIYNNGGEFDTEQYAYYLEDQWRVTDNFLLSLGVRNENFINYNGDGVAFLKGKDQWAPRVGFSWDVFGDSSLKVFGNAGRYHLTVPATVAARGASGSTYTIEYFAYDGIDPNTGAPLNAVSISPNGPYSSNSEYGQAPDPKTISANGLKPYFQDELVLGFEKQLSEKFSGGVRYVYRELGSMIDDSCDPRPVRNWGLANGFSPEEAENLWTNNTSGCRFINPGQANSFTVYDDAGNAHIANISKADMLYPEMVRKYHSLDFFLEHPFDGKVYYRIDYTWSHNYGNGEGMTNSDIGQDVAQAAATQAWDHAEQAEGAYGNLPNDRRHQIKAFGYYQVNDEWMVSGTFKAYSGRPKDCNGYYNGVNAHDDYTLDNVLYPGPYYWFCNNEPSPRGSHGNLPWTATIDLGVSYAPNFAGGKLKFGLDVFNVLNRQVVQNRIVYGENGGPGVPYSQAFRAISYNAPRSMRFAIRYDY